jgi:hypothetical protein
MNAAAIKFMFAFVALGLITGALIYSISSARIQPTVNFGDNPIMTDGTQQNTTVMLSMETVQTGSAILVPGLILVAALVIIGAILAFGRR